MTLILHFLGWLFWMVGIITACLLIRAALIALGIMDGDCADEHIDEMCGHDWKPEEHIKDEIE